MRGSGVVRAAVAVVVGGAWIGLAGPALGLEGPVIGECDALVVDPANQLSGAEEAQVAEAAAALRTATSFEPRVWVLTQDQAGPSLASWIDLQTAACSTWHAGTSEFTSNLLVLAVTTDTGALTGETYLWYGDAMPETMDDQFTEIQSDVINPALGDGDYERGLIDGLAAIEEVIDPGPPIGWIVLGSLVVLVVAVIIANRWRRRRKARELARAELARRFEAAAAGSDQAVLQLEPLFETVDSDVQLVRAGFHPEETEQLLVDVTGFLATYATLAAQRSDLVIGRDQVLKDADDASLGQIVTAWETLRGKSEELLPPLAHEADELAAALRLPESISTRLAAIPAAVELVRSAERTARELGFVPTTEVAPLASVPARATEVQRLAGERRYLAADGELTGIEADLEASRIALTTLPERFGELTERVDAAVDRRAALNARIDDARAAESTLAAQFHAAIAAEVAGSSTGASEDAARADAALVDARAGLAARDLGTAATAVITAEDGIGQAEAGAAAPGAMLERARRLATETPAALAGARAALAALRARVRPGTPTEGAVAALHARADAVSLVGMPDWPRLEVEINSIRHAADELTEQLDSEARAAAVRHAAQEAERKRGSGGGGMGFWSGLALGRSSSGSSRRSWSGGGGSSGSSGSSRSSGTRSGGGGSRSSGGRSGGGSRR